MCTRYGTGYPGTARGLQDYCKRLRRDAAAPRDRSVELGKLSVDAYPGMRHAITTSNCGRICRQTFETRCSCTRYLGTTGSFRRARIGCVPDMA
eukprot:1090642-Rhodomonas_salina.1